MDKITSHSFINKNSLSKNNENIFTSIYPLAVLCQHQPIAILIELGSNEDATRHLKQARKVLSALAVEVVWSTEFVNPDYTATANNPKPDYTNQCGYLVLNSASVINTLGELIKKTKVIEKKIQRDFYAVEAIKNVDTAEFIKTITEPKNRQVIIDIDVLAFKEQNGDWIGIKERYPFKDHEWVGINELFNNNMLN